MDETELTDKTIDENRFTVNQQDLEQYKPTSRKTVPVQVIDSKDGSVLVEYADGDDVRRCYLPASEIENGKSSKSALKAGAPYGVRWEDAVANVLPSEMAVQLGTLLRKHNIWNGDDIERDIKAVQKSIAKTTGNILKSLRRAAKEHCDKQ